MLSKINLVRVSLLLTTIFFAADSQAAPAQNVCVSSTGAITIKAKCTKKQKLLSAFSLNQEIATNLAAAGPAGPRGVPGITGVTGSTGLGPQGVQGPTGNKGAVGQIDFAGCRLTAQGYDTNFFNPSNPILYAEVYCDQNSEFILQDESYVTFFSDSVGSKSALQGRSTYVINIGGDTREYGVGVYANRFLTVGAGSYELFVRAVCCPR